MFNCSSTVSTPSRSGNKRPLFCPLLTITPYILGFNSSFIALIGFVSTSTDISISTSSSSVTSKNLGSAIAACIAFLIISFATQSVVGKIVPMHPLNCPNFLRDTNTPCLSSSISLGKSLLAIINLLFLK